MAYCRHCGAEVRSSDTFCFKCGSSLVTQPENSTPSENRPEYVASNADVVPIVQARRMDVIIDPARVIIVGLLSFGFYFFYWFYLTWKHYRDYTRTKNYPVWHALSLFVPIYCWFRVHDHIHSYKELMFEKNIDSNLNSGLFVVLFIIVNALYYVSGYISSLSTVFTIVLMCVEVLLVVWAQTNLNRFWKSTKDITPVNARVGVGEVIFCLIGLLAWYGTFAA
jgi:hypothetical protein